MPFRRSRRLLSQRMQNIIDLIIVLTQKAMKVRYKSGFLGYFRSIAHPLTFAFVFFLAFKGRRGGNMR